MRRDWRISGSVMLQGSFWTEGGCPVWAEHIDPVFDLARGGERKFAARRSNEGNGADSRCAGAGSERRDRPSDGIVLRRPSKYG